MKTGRPLRVGKSLIQNRSGKVLVRRSTASSKSASSKLGSLLEKNARD